MRHYPADRGTNIDGWVVTFLRQSAGQHYVTIQNGASRIHDRILLIIPLRQHRIEGAQGTIRVRTITGSFHQLGQHAEYRGWITSSRRRFPYCQGYFTLGLSIGLVPLAPGLRDAAAVLHAADMACYEAQCAGRNRVHLGAVRVRA